MNRFGEYLGCSKLFRQGDSKLQKSKREKTIASEKITFLFATAVHEVGKQKKATRCPGHVITAHLP